MIIGGVQPVPARGSFAYVIHLGFLGSLLRVSINSSFLMASRLPKLRTATNPASCFCLGRDLPDSQL